MFYSFVLVATFVTSVFLVNTSTGSNIDSGIDTPPPSIVDPQATAPPVLYRLSGTISYDNLFGPVVVKSMASTTGVNFPISLIEVTDPGRTASLEGHADYGVLQGRIRTILNKGGSSNPFWYGIDVQFPIEVYVQGSPGTAYTYHQSYGAQIAAASNPNSGGGSTEGRIQGRVVRNTEANPVQYDLPLVHTVSTTVGPAVFFTAYPGVPYCRVAMITLTSGNLGVNGGPVLTQHNASTNAPFYITAYKNQGVVPEAIIDGPYLGGASGPVRMENMTINKPATFVSLSYDPDNNQGTTAGVGILGWKWDVTKPNGAYFDRVSSIASLTYTPDTLGSHIIRLTVTDDEGRVRVTTQTVNVVPIEPFVESIINTTGTPAGQAACQQQFGAPCLVLVPIIDSTTGNIQDLTGLKIREVLSVPSGEACKGPVKCRVRFAISPPVGAPLRTVARPWSCFKSGTTKEFTTASTTLTGQPRLYFQDGFSHEPYCTPKNWWDYMVGTPADRSATLTVLQKYEYQLPWTAGAWKPLPPASVGGSHAIVRRVYRRNNGEWWLQVSNLGHSTEFLHP